MRLFFFILLLINISLYPFVAGLVGGNRDGAEPLRMTSQIRPDHIRIIPQDDAAPTAEAVPPASIVDASTDASTPTDAPAVCRLLDGLAREQIDALAARIRERQLAVQLGETEQTETTAWWVHIPDLPSRQLADRKLAELRALGVRDMIVMTEPDDAQKLAVSLGLFKTEAAAKELLTTLAGKGVRSARIAPREGKAGHHRVELRGAGAVVGALLADAREVVGDIEAVDCP